MGTQGTTCRTKCEEALDDLFGCGFAEHDSVFVAAAHHRDTRRSKKQTKVKQDKESKRESEDSDTAAWIGGLKPRHQEIYGEQKRLLEEERKEYRVAGKKREKAAKTRKEKKAEREERMRLEAALEAEEAERRKSARPARQKGKGAFGAFGILAIGSGGAGGVMLAAGGGL